MRFHFPFLLFLPLLISSFSFSQPLELKGEYRFQGAIQNNGDTTGISDVWGWTAPDGTDYAIVGITDGTAFVKVSDMSIRGFVPGPQQNDYYYHRDIKTYGHYAYIVSEMTGTNQGVQIVDMSPLPDANVQLVQNWTGATVVSHNLSIDTAGGFAYILKGDYTGIWVADLDDPENPVVVGLIDQPGVHDVYARNDTAWVAWGSGFSVWDMSDKSDPQEIVRLTSSNFGYCHNIWPADDGNYFVTTEETTDKTIKIWDMHNPDSVRLKGEYLGECRIAHNVHVKGDSVYVSHYASGVKVLDISDKSNPVEVAYFDTYTANDGPGFYGCWGVYPFSSNGWMYASSFEGRFHVLGFPAQSTAIAGILNTEQVSVFPNPFQDKINLHIYLEATSPIELEILSVDGKKPLSRRFEGLVPGQNKLELETGELPPGLYVYRVMSPKTQLSGKLVKW